MTLVTPLLLNVNFCPGYLDSISSDLEQDVKNMLLSMKTFFSDKLMNSEIINFTQAQNQKLS